ncbi:hypothetical protein DXG01_013853 [Tephrocybe rancida]|nr:hypothetical protein DXG01_013853 [Tephrocybe rancida]
MSGDVRQDLHRQGMPATTMLMNAQYMPNMQQAGQQPMGGPHLGLPPSSNGPNPGMMLSSAQGGINPQQRYMPMQAGGDMRQQRPMQMRPGQQGQAMIGPSGGPVPGGAGGPHMVGIPHNQAMSFPPNIMNQPQGNVVRRVLSQPQMNAGGVAGGGGGGGGGGVNNIGMGLGPAQIRQMQNLQQQQQQQMRMQGHEQLRMQGGQQHMPNSMGPDLPLNMRPGGNPGMPGRTGSAQLMNSLSQPPSMQHPLGPHPGQFQNPVQHPPQAPSPRPGSLPHTPSMNMSAPGPSHTPVNRPPMNSDDPMSFMSYQNPQFQATQHTPRMQPASNGPFPPFVPSSTPPIAISDMPQSMQGGLGTPSGTGNRFHLTPAQQYEQSHSSPGAFPHFDMAPPPTNAVPRPPSRLNPHTPLTQSQMSHHSPHSSDPIMTGHPQRPHSQPQRPSSQQARPLTPRSAHPQLPSGPPMHPPGSGTGMAPPMAVQPGPPQIQGSGPMQGPPQHLQIAPRPPPQTPVAPMPPLPPAAPPSSAPSDTPPSAAAAIPRQAPAPPVQVGQGQGLIRLLQFSAVLAAENKAQKLQLSWWSDLIGEYFTQKAMMKFTLWKDNQRNEAKPFVTTQSGVKSMTLALDGARERIYGPGHSMVECINAIWTYKYNNGYTVTLRGPLTVHVVVTAIHPSGSLPSPPSTSGQGQQQQPASNVVLRFEDFQFDANTHEKYVSLDEIKGPRTIGSPGTPRVTPLGNGSANALQSRQQQLDEDRKRWEEPRVTIEMATIPGEPVNAFGIPQATMRCLELAESVSSMADLISFSTEQQLGPLDALTKFASRLREVQPFNPSPPVIHPPLMNGPSNPFGPIHSNSSNVPPTPAVTLYSSAPPSVTNPSGNLNNHVNHAPTPVGNIASPKNAPPSANNSPQKQHKTIPQQTPGASSSSSAPAASPAVSSGGTTNTPAMSNASLKRKQAGETASPTIATETQPPAKRQTRRRRPTNAANSGGGG